MDLKLNKHFLLNCISFMIGALPLAVIVPWFMYKIDIRKYGSGNPGTTNVYRTIREQRSKSKALIATIIVGVLDILKGVIPALIYPQHAPIACLFAVLGHIYSPFLGFAGGKGVATFLGAFIGSTLNGIFWLPPVIWSILTFNNKVLAIFGIKQEWVELGPVQIKRSFFLSLVAMTLSMIMFLFTGYSSTVKLSYFAMFLFISMHHWTHIRLSESVEV